MADVEDAVVSDAVFTPLVIPVPVPDRSLDYPPPEPPNRIDSVTSDLPVFDKYVTHTNNTVTISGPITDVFERTIQYLDVDKTLKTVTKFEDVPESQLAIIKYVAPSPQIKIVTLSVNFLYGDPPYTIQITVSYNYTAANAELKVQVAKGKY